MANTVSGVHLSGTAGGTPTAGSYSVGALYSETDTNATLVASGTATWSTWHTDRIVVAGSATVKGTVSTLNFTGGTVSVSGGTATFESLAAGGGGGSVVFYDEGVVAGTAAIINVTGSGGTVSVSGGTAIIDISSSGGGVTWSSDQATSGTVTALATEGSNAASNVNDGNDTTYWSNGSTSQYPTWLKFDYGVGNTKAIRKVEVYDDGASGYGSPASWVVQYSDDDSAWFAAGDAYWNNPIQANNSTQSLYARPSKTQSVVFNEDPGAHRYWRIVIFEARNASGGNADYVRVRRVRMFLLSAGTLP